MSFSDTLFNTPSQPFKAMDVRRLSFWAALLVFLVFVGMPGLLGMSERLDSLFETEELISKGEYGPALNILADLDLDGLDAWEKRKVVLQQAVCHRFLKAYPAALKGFRTEGAYHEAIGDYLDFWQGLCMEGIGLIDSAVVYYARVVDQEPPSLLRDVAALKAAELSMEIEDPKQAAEYYRALLGKSDQEASAFVGLANALLADGDSVGARNIWWQLVREYPRHSETGRVLKTLQPFQGPAEQFYAGVAYARTKKFRQATTLFRTLIKKVSDTVWGGRAQYELGNVYYNTRRYRTAERAFERAHKVYEVPKALFEMGRCAVKRGHNLTAATRFLAFARQYPSLTGASEAMWQAAMAYERRGRHRDARKVFLKLAKTYPKSSYADRASWRAGFALYKLKEFDGAARSFLRLAQNTSENYLRDQGYYWVGKCYQKLGQEEEGMYWIGRASEGFPTSYYSARARAVIGLETEVYPETPDATPNLQNIPYEPSRFLMTGDFLASLGLYRASEREYDRALRVQGRDLYALDELLQRFERIRVMNKALQVSGRMIAQERQQGVPMTLASFRRLYPTYYWGEVNEAALEMDLDPNLILAIMRQESAFDEEAMSRVGARGLMQVMPTTGKQMARKVKLNPFSTEDLWNPQVSIRLGGQHLSDHLRTFRREDERKLGLALSAYNAGLTAARRWSRRLTRRDMDEFVESIPYKETRTYVKLVYRNYQVYSYLQGDEPAQLEEMVH